MAEYKVPQDVEAEDKLLGPFSFRQFIYLIIAAMGGLLMYGLGQLFWGLALIPLPIVAFFLIIALPLRKDQPMETYVVALVQFFLKPRIRIWFPEGDLAPVEITAAKVTEGPTLKDMTGTEASERLRYLAQVVDTHGWATRGLTSATSNVSLNDTIVAEAQATEDIFDSHAAVSQQFGAMIDQNDAARKQALVSSMFNPPAQQPVQQTPQQPLQQPDAPTPSQVNYSIPPTQQPFNPAPEPVVPQAAAQFVTESVVVTPQVPTAAPVAPEPAVVPEFEPYPTSMRQKVILPASEQAARVQQAVATTSQAQASSVETVSPDIMRLANNNDLSISTIAREAERLQKQDSGEEVVVSLR